MKSPNRKSPKRRSHIRKSHNRKSPKRRLSNRKSHRKISPKKISPKKSPKCKKISKMVKSALDSENNKYYKSAQSFDKKLSSNKKYKSEESSDKEEQFYEIELTPEEKNIESTKSFRDLKKKWLDCAPWRERFPMCEVGKFFERYFNEYYNIDIIGMQQPENLDIDSISQCLKIFSENDDVYKIISFNGFKNNDSGKERVASTILEEMYINENYSKGGVKKFINIPVEDYKPPTTQNLLDLWKILDEFHILKIDNPKLNIVMHCTCGFGRTGTMIMSYLMYKMYKDTPPLTENFESLDSIIDILNLNSNYENIYYDNLMQKSLDSIQILNIISNYENFYYDDLTQKNYIQYIRTELKKYSRYSFYEVFFDRSGSKKLLIDRLIIIIQTIKGLKM